MFPLLAFSQYFMPAWSSGGQSNKGMVILQNGDTISGKFGIVSNIQNIKSLTIKDENDVKHKLEAEQIKKVLVKVQNLAKFTVETSSIKDMSQTSYAKVANTEYYIWEPAVTPKKGKMKVMQLVNSGFDSKMKVYRNPTSGETGGVGIGGIPLTGGIEKSYYIVKAGADIAIEVEKGKYKKQYFEIFAYDCPKLKEALDDKKPDWDGFPAHVFIYDQLCEPGE
jgi:hypothetical protein